MALKALGHEKHEVAAIMSIPLEKWELTDFYFLPPGDPRPRFDEARYVVSQENSYLVFDFINDKLYSVCYASRALDSLPPGEYKEALYFSDKLTSACFSAGSQTRYGVDAGQEIFCITDVKRRKQMDRWIKEFS